MRTFLLVLRVFVPVLLLVAGLHLVLGVNAEVLLGAKLPAEVVSEPTLNSQNRFYGVSYALYGALLFLCTTDIKRYGPVFKVVMWTSLVAGASRLVAWALHGAPSPLVVFLLATEMVFPVLLLLWHAKVKRDA
jgi:Domain of unknown function (DUF4345)